MRSRCWLPTALSLMRHGMQLLPAPSAGPPAVLPRCDCPPGRRKPPAVALPATARRPSGWCSSATTFRPQPTGKEVQVSRAPELAPTLRAPDAVAAAGAQRAESNRPDLILAVPRMQRAVGTVVTTRAICWPGRWRTWGCAYRPAALRRVRKTALQQRLSAGARGGRCTCGRALSIRTVPVAGRRISPWWMTW
ncbi:hypothetical protein M8494_30430 [Serratia ureilytica]